MSADAEAARYALLKQAWEQIDSLSPAERTERLRAIETTDPALAAALRRRLATSLRAPDLLDRVERSGEPPRLPHYRLLRELGRGGMGRVWLAERTLDDARQLVALKQIGHAHWNDEDLLRFQRERRILAALDHPNIGSLIDGGRDDSGAPYLATNYVDGAHLDDWCREHAVPRRERVRLMRDVASAVAHAHRRLVVHRDLKPANILVTADGVPKLLDFGIARLLAEEAITTTGPSQMTLRYAAPEQVRGDAAQAGTAVDIYALGVLLYELIAERSPYADAVGTAALLRAILEHQPVPPTRTRRDSADPDLDAICGKALRKSPEERYASADALVADLDRWLRREPVDARRGEQGYRLRALWRRHWPALTTAALVLLSALGFLAFHLQRMQQQLADTERERDKARAVSAYFSELFDAASPSETRGDELSARELLRRSVARLAEGDTQQVDDDGRAAMFMAAGKVMLEQGLLDEAATLFDRAAALWLSLPQPPEDDLADALHDRSRVDYRRGNYLAAATRTQQTIDRRTALGDADSYQLGVLVQSMAVYQRMLGDESGARASLTRAIAILERQLPASRFNYATLLGNLGTQEMQSGDPEAGHRHLSEGVAQLQRLKPERTGALLTLQRNLAASLRELQRFDEADTAYRENLERMRAFFGNEHLDVARTLHSYAQTLIVQGRLDEAGELLDEAERIERALGPADGPRLLPYRADRARILLARGEFSAAAELLQQIAERRGDAPAGERANLPAEKAALAYARCRMAASPELAAEIKDAVAAMDENPPLPRAFIGMAQKWARECGA